MFQNILALLFILKLKFMSKEFVFGLKKLFFFAKLIVSFLFTAYKKQVKDKKEEKM